MGKLFVQPNVKPIIFSNDKYINKVKGIRLKKSDALLEQLCISNELIAVLLSQQLNGIIEKLNTLPINYPLQSIQIESAVIEVTHFLGIEDNIATFKNGDSLMVADASKIIGITY